MPELSSVTVGHLSCPEYNSVVREPGTQPSRRAHEVKNHPRKLHVSEKKSKGSDITGQKIFGKYTSGKASAQCAMHGAAREDWLNSMINVSWVC
jgi:hypothetical protein